MSTTTPDPHVLHRFQALGLDLSLASQATASSRVTRSLNDLLDESKLKSVERTQAILLYEIATSLPVTLTSHRPLLVKYILEKKLKSRLQIDAGKRNTPFHDQILL